MNWVMHIDICFFPREMVPLVYDDDATDTGSSRKLPTLFMFFSFRCLINHLTFLWLWEKPAREMLTNATRCLFSLCMLHYIEYICMYKYYIEYILCICWVNKGKKISRSNRNWRNMWKINLNTKNIFKPMLKSVKRKVNRQKEEWERKEGKL